MWALAARSEPQGSRLGRSGQPLSIGGVLAPRFRRWWKRNLPLSRAEAHRSDVWCPKVLAQTNPGRVWGEQDLGRRLLCVSDLGSPREGGGCEVAIPHGSCHTWVFVALKHLVIQNINSLAMKYIEQITITIGKTICNPDLKISLSPFGSQLKMSENLNPK